jgi:hypothetical protein
MSATIHKFPRAYAPPDEPEIAPNISERQSRRMTLWLIDCEKYLGLKTTRAMLVVAMKWVDGRLQFKRT